MTLLEVAGIRVEEEGNLILQDINFTQQQHQKIAVAGETGSGKSTLLQTIAGLVQPAAGKVLFQGERVQGPHEVLVAGHPGIAYLSQQFELPQFLRVEQVLKYVNTLTEEEAATLYDVCRISHLAKRRTNQLSGGERQRIALARLLSSWPSLLLLDEPFSNLDAGHKSVLKSVIEDIGHYLDITCILISHDPHDTLSWADDILVLKDGKIVQQGTPEQIYRHPVDEYTAALFGSYNLLPADKFTNLSGHTPENKNLLIRPEHFILNNGNTAGLKGKVTNVKFFGSFTEVEVDINDRLVTVRTGARHIKEGDEVQVSVPPADFWYI